MYFFSFVVKVNKCFNTIIFCLLWKNTITWLCNCYVNEPLFIGQTCLHSWTNSTNFGSYYIYFLLGKAIFLGYTYITGIVWKMIYSAISPLQYKIKNLDFQKKVFNPLRLLNSGLKMKKGR